jgi:eukaryotic-like serine/threonine-protein kinase
MQQPLDVGTVIDGKYRIERSIGAGGMGMVFMARHLQLRERVAIKVLKPDRSGRPGLVERLLREARAAASIRNRHAVRVLDVGTLPDGQPFVVMEFLEGEDLATLLARSGPLSVSDAVDRLLEACEALAEAHALGIVHRDLKPANLFLERRASGAVSVKVVDFGVARFLAGHEDAARSDSGLTNSDAFVGSPAYVSPEQLTTPDRVDTRADIWALGVILHEMLSGSQPFTAPTLALTCTKILQDPPPPLERSGVPPELVQALERALEKDPERRFASVLELGAALAPHGSSQARASLAEIEAIAQRDPSAPESTPATKLNERGTPSTLTGSVLKAGRTTPQRRVRLALAVLGTAVAIVSLAYVALRSAPTDGIASQHDAPSAPPVAITQAASEAATSPPEPEASIAGPPPLASASTRHVSPVRAGAHAAAALRPSARAVVVHPPSPAVSARPSNDESERLYEFRK